ncbi:MAG: hypothetical protein QME90_19850, partial [Thermodesulfobacteriota bacterium]|nr:hypothetical protein [Thermodesulfobacteriota bacterium]
TLTLPPQGGGDIGEGKTSKKEVMSRHRMVGGKKGDFRFYLFFSGLETRFYPGRDRSPDLT